MGITEKKRQKKLDRKNKKRKLAKKLSVVGVDTIITPSNYAKYPIHECLIPNTLFDTGMGYVVVSRLTPDRLIAISAFVLDVQCLGVKNALFKVSNEAEYEDVVKQQLLNSSGDIQFENVHPACAVKLIEGAVLYARELGFSPHKDYKNAKKMFGDIDASACPVKYVYGKDGKPFYMRGPYESVDQAKNIVNKLSEKCGEGNFDYIVMLDEGMIE